MHSFRQFNHLSIFPKICPFSKRSEINLPVLLKSLPINKCLFALGV